MYEQTPFRPWQRDSAGLTEDKPSLKLIVQTIADKPNRQLARLAVVHEFDSSQS